VLVQVGPLLKLAPRWAQHLSADADAETVRQLRRHEATGRPAGGERFLRRLEKLLGRVLRPRKPGRKKNSGVK
jgi:putative transposase